MTELVDTNIEDSRWEALDLDALAERAATATLRDLGLDPTVFEISLLGCNDARIAALNTDFRGKAQQTNVLSWPSQDRAAAIPGAAPTPPGGATPQQPLELGDIAISWDTCEREAHAAGVSMSDHATHLLVHGVLHLLGYDHTRDADATLMEAVEVRILAQLGLSDPYRRDRAGPEENGKGS